MGVWEGGVWWLRKMEEALRVLRCGLPGQLSLTAVVSPPLCLPLPHPALFSFFRTTSLFLTSRTPAATPHPRRPPRPPRQRPRSHPAPRRLLPYTLLRSAQGSRRISTCQVPSACGRSRGEVSGSCQSRVRPVHVKGDGLEAYGLSLTIGRATAP